MDPDFQQQYSRHNLKTILADLKQEWAREYDQFAQDAELKRLAEEQAPKVLEWFEARVKIVQLAERIMVAPAPPPDEEALARELRQDQIQADNGIARAKLKAEKILKAKAELESIPLDDEERERLETELTEDILDLGKETNNGKTL